MAQGRLFPWLVICALAVPAVFYGLYSLGQYVWSQVPHISALITVATFKRFEGVISMGPGEFAETVRLVLITLFSSLLCSIATGLFMESWRRRLTTAAAVFPGWILVMSVAAIVIYEYASTVDPSLQRATIVCNFLVAFAAFATTSGLALLLWTRLPAQDGGA